MQCENVRTAPRITTGIEPAMLPRGVSRLPGRVQSWPATQHIQVPWTCIPSDKRDICSLYRYRWTFHSLGYVHVDRIIASCFAALQFFIKSCGHLPLPGGAPCQRNSLSGVGMHLQSRFMDSRFRSVSPHRYLCSNLADSFWSDIGYDNTFLIHSLC